MNTSKTLILMIVTFVLFNACSQSTKSKDDSANPNTGDEVAVVRDYLIGSKSIEGFKIDDIFTEKSGEFSYEEKLRDFHSEEGVETMNVVAVSDKEGKLFDLVLLDRRIYRIIIESDRYKTQNGISINSSLDDFSQAYADYLIVYSYVSDSFWLNSDSIDAVNFYFDKECYKGSKDALYNSDMVILNRSDMSDDCKIKSIEIY